MPVDTVTVAELESPRSRSPSGSGQMVSSHQSTLTADGRKEGYLLETFEWDAALEPPHGNGERRSAQYST